MNYNSNINLDPNTTQILGMHILAPNSGNLIAQAMAFVQNKNTIDDVLASPSVFLTMSEAVKKFVALSFVKNIAKLSYCV